MLGDSGQDVNRQPVGLWEVNGVKLHAGLHQVRNERDIAREPIELGDDQGRSVKPAELERFGELRPITALAALDLRDLSHQAPVAAVKVVLDGSSLCFQAKP